MTSHHPKPILLDRCTFSRRLLSSAQGVDDVYTDPQIDTSAVDDYGEGNLGISGMALFFSTSQYDGLCQSLGLPDFALSGREKRRIEGKHEEQADPLLPLPRPLLPLTHAPPTCRQARGARVALEPR